MFIKTAGRTKLAIAWAIFFVTVCAASLKGAAQALASGSTPVILITVDTLRPDHLGCYGNRNQFTPQIDALTNDGAVFLQAISQAPLTLPSHTTLLTSTYPFSNRVEENGERVPPGALTLASILKSHGYRTAAFVGGFVLDRRFGLDQGFDFYDSPFKVEPQPEQGTVDLKRNASEVIGSASKWLDGGSGHPFFIFIHLFDLHRPYTLRTASSEQNVKGYDAELHYVDQELGGFWKYLENSGLFDKCLIVFTSDHGESLGEHGEQTHGYFIYESTLRVPLIFHWPAGHSGLSAQSAAPVGLIDVAPTILQFLGIAVPPTFQGRSLLPMFARNHAVPPEEIYSESLYARDHFGWAALRSLRIGDYKYISAPKPELYDLACDPQELHNLVSSQEARASELALRLQALESRYMPVLQAKTARPSLEELDLLSSLGYTEVVHAKSGPDPKDKLVEYRQYQEAIQLASFGHYSQAAEILRKITAMDYENVQAHFNLAVCDFKITHQEEAIKELDATLSLNPDFVRAQELLGTIFLQRNDYARAREQYEKLLAILPADYGANYNLGVLDLMDSRLDSALEHFKKAGQAAPRSAIVYDAIGHVYLRENQLRKAQSEFEEEVCLEPNSPVAHYNLGLAFEREQLREQAAAQFREALARDPGYQPAREALDQLGKQ